MIARRLNLLEQKRTDVPFQSPQRHGTPASGIGPLLASAACPPHDPSSFIHVTGAAALFKEPTVTEWALGGGPLCGRKRDVGARRLGASSEVNDRRWAVIPEHRGVATGVKPGMAMAHGDEVLDEAFMPFL
ncbi:hypothetical protein HJFPF1_07608 [Paramyrothecium foliicola]|nr:hypothetical protein HJFPF1_07608 [Paramyrothecium foliicola]